MQNGKALNRPSAVQAVLEYDLPKPGYYGLALHVIAQAADDAADARDRLSRPSESLSLSDWRTLYHVSSFAEYALPIWARLARLPVEDIIHGLAVNSIPTNLLRWRQLLRSSSKKYTT